MKRTCYLIAAMLLVLGGDSYAQLGTVASPVQLDFGIGGGVSLPSGDLSNVNNSGWHAAGKVRVHGFMLLNVIASVGYHRLPNKIGGESDTYLQIGGGLEYSFPAPTVMPYLGVDGFYNSSSNTGQGSSSVSRGGLGVGGGVEFSVPSFGSIDASVKYQMLNLMGKQTSEFSYSQITATVALMFGVL